METVMNFKLWVYTCGLSLMSHVSINAHLPAMSQEAIRLAAMQQKDNIKWEIIQNGSFSFWVGQRQAGELHMQYNIKESRADIILEGKKYTLKKTGFWKNNFELVSEDGEILARTYHDKEIPKLTILEFGGQKFEIISHNNPMSELAILKDGKIELAYSLHPDNGSLEIAIKDKGEDVDYMLHYIVWYLYHPIAQYAIGNEYRFSKL
jgi:hypothetical protein